MWFTRSPGRLRKRGQKEVTECWDWVGAVESVFPSSQTSRHRESKQPWEATLRSVPSFPPLSMCFPNGRCSQYKQQGKSCCPCLEHSAFSKGVHTSIRHSTSSTYNVTLKVLLQEVEPIPSPSHLSGFGTAGKGCSMISEVGLWQVLELPACSPSWYTYCGSTKKSGYPEATMPERPRGEATCDRGAPSAPAQPQTGEEANLQFPLPPRFWAAQLIASG